MEVQGEGREEEGVVCTLSRYCVNVISSACSVHRRVTIMGSLLGTDYGTESTSGDVALAAAMCETEERRAESSLQWVGECGERRSREQRRHHDSLTDHLSYTEQGRPLHDQRRLEEGLSTVAHHCSATTQHPARGGRGGQPRQRGHRHHSPALRHHTCSSILHLLIHSACIGPCRGADVGY